MRHSPLFAARPVLLAALLLVPAFAWSQDDPVRRSLIQQATQARDRNDHARALELAREAASRRMSTSLRTFLAQECAAVGQNETAITHARTCVQEAEADPNLANGPALLAECRALIERLAPPAPQPPPTQPPPAPPPSPPVVSAPPSPPEPLSAPPHGLSQPPLDTPPPTTTSHGPGAGPWVVAGFGVASFAAAGIFYALRNDARSQRDSYCNGRSPCELELQPDVNVATSAQDRASTYNLLTNVALGVGGAAVGAGVLWFILGRSTSDAPPSTALTVLPHADGAYVGLRGAM